MRRRFEQAGCYVQKLADSSAPFIGRPDLGGDQRARFAPRNPFDFFVLRPRPMLTFWAFAFELKSTSLPRFDLGTVKDHQLTGLQRFPGISGAIVEIRPATRCFFVRTSVLSSWTEETGKRSMNLEDLTARAVELPRDTKGRERKDYFSVRPVLRGAAE